jgi:FkbM family methyltransferase
MYKFMVNAGLRNVAHDAVVKFAVKCLRRGDCVIDVGANRGTYSYSMLKAVGKHGKVYSFEPNPIIAEQLKKNLRYSNAVIENTAVSNISGDRIFYRHTKGCGPTSSLEFFDVLDKSGEIEETKVKSITLDSFCQSHNLSPNLIKIDVEGHEFNVFKGAESTIRSFRPYIIFEFIEEFWQEKRIKAIFEFLVPAYNLIRIEDGANAINAYLDYKPHCYPDFRVSRVVNIGCIPKGNNSVLGRI